VCHDVVAFALRAPTPQSAKPRRAFISSIDLRRMSVISSPEKEVTHRVRSSLAQVISLSAGADSEAPSVPSTSATRVSATIYRYGVASDDSYVLCA
jgi:hypothetical protein